MLETVPVDKSRSYIPVVEKNIQRDVYSTSRHFYINLLKLCLLIIRRFSVKIEVNGGYVELPSYIFDMSKVFQDYLLNTLISTLGRNIVHDGNKRSYNKPLFDDKEQPRAEPDLIIQNSEKAIKLIVDSKYKEKPKREDYNQLISYCLSYKSKIGLFICPKASENVSGERFIGTISGIKILIYYVDMNSEDLLIEEHNLSKYIESLMNGTI
jgi:5-methylcytosine-specific restriction enzyme subunit McrC